MKKLLASIFILFTSTGLLQALPCGSPADPALYTHGLIWDDCFEECYCDDGLWGPCGFCWGEFSIRFGYFGDFVFDRNLKEKATDERIDHTHISTNAALLVLNLWNRIDFYGIFGHGRFAMERFIFDPDLLAEGTKLETVGDNNFTWRIGFKGVLWQSECTYIGLDFQYFSFQPNIERVTFAEAFSVYPDDTFRFTFKEWQFNLGIAHRINAFIPYIAVKWSHAEVIFDDDDFPFIPFIGFINYRNLEGVKRLGYAIGVTFLDDEAISLNVEARFRDESALTATAQFRF